MTKKQRIEAFARLGEYLLEGDGKLQQVMESAQHGNPWFTLPNLKKAVQALALNLTADRLQHWLAPYPLDDDSAKTAGLILAGNIPLVGFHDILCVLCAGFNVQVKPSASDPVLTAHLLAKLQEIEPAFAPKISIRERLTDFDVIIATGSDNSARYFSYYFGNKPHIIRKNRNSVAVLTGEESPAELRLLGTDVFDYFGLGCRSVSKLFVPENYELAVLFEELAPFADLINYHKYANNYDYNKSIYLINGDTHFDNGFLLVKPDDRTASPLAVLYLETYTDAETLTERLNAQSDLLQCVVTAKPWPITTPTVRFGQSQQPALDDYADGVNTLQFLAEHR